MDVRKILHKINLILRIENRHDLQRHFNEITSFYASNDPDSLKVAQETISQAIEHSEISNFVNSDLRMLGGIGIRGYFDLESIETLSKILESTGFAVPNQLGEFVATRERLVEKIRNLQALLQQLKVKEEQTKEIYQFVLSLPGKYQDLNELENFLKDIKTLLQELNSKDQNASPPRIVSVNNGSMDIFIEVVPLLAEQLGNVIDHLLRMYAVTQIFENVKDRYGNFKKSRKEEMDKNIDEELKEQKEEMLGELLEKLPVNTDEGKTRLKKLIGELTKHLENGVQAEIKTPEIEEPEEASDEDDAETQKRKKEELERFKRKKAIDDLNKQLFLAQKKGFKLGLLNPPEEDESTE